MGKTELTPSQQAYLQEFKNDSNLIGVQTEKFLRMVYPSYLVDTNNLTELIDPDSTLRLQSTTFFRISSCTADNVDEVFECVNERFEKLFTALYSINIPIAYGIISCDGVTNLVLGVYNSGDAETVKTITQGMLSGIDVTPYVPDFSCKAEKRMNYGIMSGIPSLYVKEKKQTFSLSPIMRSLNGQNYTLLFVAKPVSHDVITQNISELISVRDNAFAVSKRNVARSNSYAKTTSETENQGDSQSSIAGAVGSGVGSAVGTATGAIIGTIVLPGFGTMIGTGIGGAVGGGLGTTIGNIVGKGKSHSEGYSKAISEAITDGQTISGDIQNGFALELMNYADNAIERLKGGQNNGIWQYNSSVSKRRAIKAGCREVADVGL